MSGNGIKISEWTEPRVVNLWLRSDLKEQSYNFRWLKVSLEHTSYWQVHVHIAEWQILHRDVIAASAVRVYVCEAVSTR